MRAKADNGTYALHVITGTRSVLVGIDATPDGRERLLGFAIRRDHHRDDGSTRMSWLPGFLTFEKERGGRLDKAPDVSGSEDDPLGFEYDPRVQPVQDFLWGDFSAEPGADYSYTLIPVIGTAASPTPDESRAVTVRLRTELERDPASVHEIYFNRGAAASQEYAWRFGAEPPARPPEEVAFMTPENPLSKRDQEIYRWLSRGLEEAMLGFIGQADSPAQALRAAVYEFSYDPALKAFGKAAGIDYESIGAAHRAGADSVVKAAQDGNDVTRAFSKANAQIQKAIDVALTEASGRGSDVLIVYDAKPPKYQQKKDKDKKPIPQLDHDGNPMLDSEGAPIYQMEYVERGPGSTAQLAISRALINRLVNRRTQPLSSISHNKFIVLLTRASERAALAPTAVWTGSTNFTASGIFGQSNVGHIVRDPAVAKTYLHYWEHLNNNPTGSDFQAINDRDTPFSDTDPKPDSIQVVFSPRGADNARPFAALERYAALLGGARESAHLTAAFGVSSQIATQILAPSSRIVYLLLEDDGQTRSKASIKDMEKATTDGTITVRIARGDTIDPGAVSNAGMLDRWRQETLTGLNENVLYIHTKYMIVDALTDDPIVITGSANFSESSTTSNDENMLVIRGDKRVADIYLCEFMRLFGHFIFRNKFNRAFRSSTRAQDSKQKQLLYLVDGSSWTDKFYDPANPRAKERLLFSGFPKK